jgi:hypothetical protein
MFTPFTPVAVIVPLLTIDPPPLITALPDPFVPEVSLMAIEPVLTKLSPLPSKIAEKLLTEAVSRVAVMVPLLVKAKALPELIP